MMRFASFVSLVSIFLSAAAAENPTAISVGNATSRAGEVAYGVIAVPAGVDAATSIAVTVINGQRSGPVVAFVAGSHGTEYASIVALIRLHERIQPKDLVGTVIIVPLVNVASFEQMTVHTNPIDRKGMNSQYPGDAAGTQTQRALRALAEQVVKRADVIVDLHGGDLDEDLIPYSYWFRTGNEQQDSASKKLALAFGLDRIIVSDIDPSNASSTRSLSGYALSLGKTVLVAEAGRVGTVTVGDVTSLIDGSLNVLASLGMINRPLPPLVHPIWLANGARVRAAAAGMFTPAVAGGTYVSAGMRIGTMSDYYGRQTSEITAPLAGVVTFIRGVPSAWAEATLANIAPVFAEPPPYRKP